jgi:predicted SAM-dependent methyltransferase
MKFLEIAGNFKRSPEWDVIRDMKVRGGIVHDMTKLPIPGIEDSVYDGVHSEHFIEHLTKDQGISFLKEMYRVMKDGAVIRTVWPSMDFVDQLKNDPSMETNSFVLMYNQYIIDRENPFSKPYYNSFANIAQMSKREKAALRLLHQEGEHKHLWYKQELIDTLTEIGFKSAKEQSYRQSIIEPFNNIDNKDPMRTLHSTVVEAIK